MLLLCLIVTAFVWEIVSFIRSKELTTVRVAALPQNVREALVARYSDKKVQPLPNGVTLIDVQAFNGEELAGIAAFWNEHAVTEFTLGKVTLNDLYSMYYHKS